MWLHMLVERGPGQDWRWAGRSDPLAAFGHELRNVLTPLREGVALVCDQAVGPLSETQRKLLEGVREDAERIARMADEMVATSRLRCRRARIAAHQVNAAELATGVVRSLEAVAARRRVNLSVAEADPDAVCRADPDLLRQALVNLVDNALKFTPEDGQVRVGVRRLADENGEGFVELSVRDTGPGLSEEKLRRISDRRSGAGIASGECRGAGLGIGLLIVREIAEQHGGRLMVESVPGAGSCFRLEVPTDFRRGERWLLAQIAEGITLAKAVGAPLSAVEIRVVSETGAAAQWASGRGLVQLPLIEQCLEDGLRPSDTVVLGESSATLVLYDVDGSGARRVAGRTVAALARLFATLPEPYPRCGIALGVGSYPADGSTPAEVAEAARRDLGLCIIGPSAPEAPLASGAAPVWESTGDACAAHVAGAGDEKKGD
jgi:two-component sensor histidine kinase